jgi:hypothetical protein
MLRVGCASAIPEEKKLSTLAHALLHDGQGQAEIPPNGAHRRIDDAFVLLEFALEDPIYLGFVHLSLLYI